MGWTNPRTWVVAEMVTHTVLNVHVRDNLLFIGTFHLHRIGLEGQGSVGIRPDSIAWNVTVGVISTGGIARHLDDLIYSDAGGTFTISGLNGTTTAALIAVGTIEATTGGTIGADGTHNHVV